MRVGVVGVGAIGQHHVRQYLAGEDGAQLVGIYDIDEARAREVARQLNTEAFADPDALADAVDGLSIAVPTSRHYDVAKAMLASGKHVLIEKPITETIAQANELLRMAEERNLIIQVGHVERFNPVISYLEERATNPRFIECHRLAAYPPPRPGQAPRGTETGVVLDLMIHDIDMVLNLVKSPLENIDAVGIPVLSETEDIANARLRFENGCVVNLTTSRLTPNPLRKIRVFQQDCYISLDYQARAGTVWFKDEDGGITMESAPVDDYDALRRQLEHFAACVDEFNRTGRRPTGKVPGEHGLRALEVALRIGEVIREGGGVLDIATPS